MQPPENEFLVYRIIRIFLVSSIEVVMMKTMIFDLHQKEHFPSGEIWRRNMLDIFLPGYGVTLPIEEGSDDEHR